MMINFSFTSRLCVMLMGASLCLLSLCGCGGPTAPKPVEVTGTVTRGGRPIDSLLVFFEPLAKGKASVGKTDASGKFTLALGSELKGAVPGEYVVYFNFVGKTPADEMAYQQGTLKLTEDLEVATKKYANAASSPLKVTVKAGGPQEIPLQLE